MNGLFKIFLSTMLLLNGQSALATPQADASYIVQRNMDPDTLEFVRRHLKSAFVSVYHRPLSELGIEIADIDRFIELIPEDDIAPFVDHFLSQTAERYLLIYTPEQLSSIAALLRADESATMEEILSEEYRQRYADALGKARAQAVPSGSDDPTVIAAEELIVQLEAVNAIFEDGGAEAFAKNMAASIAPLFILVGYGHQIGQLQRELDNPVTLSLLETDGVLLFANPVQRQALLRQLSAPESTGGIRFLKPPIRNQSSN